MSFTFKPAVREQVSILIALAGASGSGKTMSALRLAQGMSPDGKIAFIDTEARRGLHYADQFSFMHLDMRPPFRPSRFMEAVRVAEEDGATVIIIDSFSHEWDGEGGLHDWADELEAAGTKPPGNWNLPKKGPQGHGKMMNAFLQCRASLIFCLRAEEKIAIEKVDIEENGRTRKKTVITPLGWVPICEKRFMFEMTTSFTLRPDRAGIPQFDLPHKLQEQHKAMFPEGKHIGQAAGEALAAWAKGAPSAAALLAEGDEAADFGRVAVTTFWSRLSNDQRHQVGGTAQRDAWLAFVAKAEREAGHRSEPDDIDSDADARSEA